MTVFALNSLKSEVVTRFSSGADELDWVYGHPGNYGIPCGRISLWAGQHGVGKTRLLVQLMKQWDRMGLSSLIFQGEVSKEQFAGEKFSEWKSDRIFISDDRKIDDQIAVIASVKPDIVITDSVQQVEEYDGGRGSREIVRKIRDVIGPIGAHLIFISHLNKAGTSSGTTELPHEIDIEAYLQRVKINFDKIKTMEQLREVWGLDVPGVFSMELSKNRYGSSGKKIYFKHTNTGVECISQHRLRDPAWMREHPIRRDIVTPEPVITARFSFWKNFLGIR